MLSFEMNLKGLFLCVLLATASTAVRFDLGMSVHMLTQAVLPLHSIAADLTQVGLLLRVRYHVIL